MNDDLRRKALVRKGIYFGVLIALFTVSMFWRGVFPLPVGNSQNDPPQGVGDSIARAPIKHQAQTLEMRELDLGDAEVAGSLAQVSLVGLRGFVVTGLWLSTQNSQKRGEYDEMERTAAMVSRLQPHFTTPWEFQAWNISYNVSVETDKLGDQYYYIAKGISFLAEGDRLNTRTLRRGKDVYSVGSPDLRYQLGFYTQNKFSVADKVATLLCLSQLSLLPPDDRDPNKLRVTGPDGKPTGRVDPVRFEEFCRKNPQLVRRLKTQLNCKKPEQVAEFLETNWRIPARYDVETKAAWPEDKAFPVFPRADQAQDPSLFGYIDSLQRMLGQPAAAGRDALDIRRVARAWFEHAQAVVPPPVEGEPSAAPVTGEYDEYRYRIPTRPALIVFRMSPARAQVYVAERLQKEGWFDRDTAWNPDDGADRDARWFPPARPGEPAREVSLQAGTSARAEWEESYTQWRVFGTRNGMNEADRLRYQLLAEQTVAAGLPPLGQPLMREFSDGELAALNPPLERRHLRARNAVMYYGQNRNITNYQFFLDSTLAEKEPELARARELFWQADQLHARNSEEEAGVRVRASALWRRVLTTRHADYYQAERSDPLHETTLDQELALARLLTKDEAVGKRVTAAREALGGLMPAFGASKEPQAAVVRAGADAALVRAASEDEARTRIALALAESDVNNELLGRAKRDVDQFLKDFPNPPKKPTVEDTARGLLAGELSWMKTDFQGQSGRYEWVRAHVRYQRMVKDGVIVPPAPVDAGVGPDGQPLPPPTPVRVPAPAPG